MCVPGAAAAGAPTKAATLAVRVRTRLCMHKCARAELYMQAGAGAATTAAAVVTPAAATTTAAVVLPVAATTAAAG